MKIIDRINISQYTHIGISKKGIKHLGYWDDDNNAMKWVPQYLFNKTKNRQKRTEFMSI